MEYQDNNKILRDKYDGLTDGELIAMILAEPHNEEAAVYLLYERYNAPLRKIYSDLGRDPGFEFFDDSLHDLFMFLRSRKGTWRKIATYDGSGTFGGWLWKVAKRKFPKILDKLIEKGGITVSIDEDNPDKPTIQIPVDPEREYERRRLRVHIFEAISKLQPIDRRFMCKKKFDGYSSREIAEMLKILWEREGIVRYDNKGNVVVPSEDYVNSSLQKARRDLKKILKDIREEIL